MLEGVGLEKVVMFVDLRVLVINVTEPSVPGLAQSKTQTSFVPITNHTIFDKTPDLATLVLLLFLLSLS